jgi:hydroxymethylglutaryl-CoA synthase
MSETGIMAFGAYVPWRRFERQAMARNTAWYNQEVAAARGERAWCGWDEDVFTMAVEAVRDCLPAQAARERLSAVLLATTTAPFADRSGAAIVREAAGLPAGALCLDVGGSYRAGTSALLSALRLASGEDAPVLCVAAEQVTSAPASTEELQSGDAAAAFVTGTRDVIAEYLGGHSTAADFVDHFRPRDSMHNYFWETRWARDEGVLSLVPAAVREALRASGINAADVDRFILPVPIKNAAASAAKRIGIPVESVDTGLAGRVGYAGAAAALVDLAAALEDMPEGHVVVIASFGSGCDVLVLRRTGIRVTPPGRGVSGWLARRTVDNIYLKFLAARDALRLSGGLRAEYDQKQSMSALWRNRFALLSLTAALDTATGEVVFPPPAGTRLGQDGVMGVSLADRLATVRTLTADRLAYSLDPPTYYGMVDFAGGGRLVAEYCDVQPDALAVGATVRMMFRIKALDARRGFRSYFWKASPEPAGQREET